VVPGEVIANLDFRLRPPIAGSLTGQIRDSNGAPAAGVHISATPVAPGIRVYLTETDQDGRYGLDVMQGTYLISATAPSQRLSSAEGRVVTVTAGEFIKGLDFSFPPPGNTCGVAGIVPGTVRMVNGSPLPGLSLLRLSWEFRIDGILQTVNISRTDAGGSFTLSNLRQGATTIAVAKAPLGYYVKALTFGGTDLLKAPLVLPTLSCSAQIEIVLARTTRDHGVRISGRATNLEFPLSRDLGLLLTELPRTGEPAPPGSDLSDLEFTANRRTGVFSLEGVPAGRYKLTGYLSNFTQAELIIDVARNDVADLELRFGTSAKPGAPTPLNSSATAVIRGVVEGASGGVPGFVIEFASMRVGVQALSIAVSGREFTVQLPQGEYRASVSGLPRGYNLDSLTAGPLDLREPFLVTEKGIADRFTGAPIPDSAGGPEAKAPAGISVRLKAPGN
jgi:hypothetical protein